MLRYEIVSDHFYLKYIHIQLFIFYVKFTVTGDFRTDGFGWRRHLYLRSSRNWMIRCQKLQHRDANAVEMTLFLAILIAHAHNMLLTLPPLRISMMLLKKSNDEMIG